MKKRVKETLLDPATSSCAALKAWVKQSERTATELQASEGRFNEVDRALARHPNATSALLSTLSHSSDKATRKAVISHLAVLPEDFLRLGPQFPKEFLGNAALDLMLLEDVGRFLEFDGKLLVQIVKRENCPEGFIQWALSQGDEKLSLAVAMNPNISESVIALLQESQFPKVQEAITHHVAAIGHADVAAGTPEDALLCEIKRYLQNLDRWAATEAWDKGYLGLAQFQFLSLESQLEIMGLLYGDINSSLARNCLPEMLECLILDPVGDVRLAAATNPNLTAVQIDYLLETSNSRLLENLAANRSVGRKHIKLSKAADKNIRGSVKNLNCPVDLLKLLAKDKDYRVRSSVAKNLNCPVDLLVLLAKDKNEHVRLRVGQNPNCPVSLLEELTKDDEWQGRYGAVSNPNCPVELLVLLAKDDNEYVRVEVAKNSNYPVTLLGELAMNGEEGCRSVAENPKCPVSLLEALAKDKVEWVRISVAKNPNCPASLLEELTKDEWRIRAGVADNPNCPVALLILLAEDKDKNVRYSVASNPSCPVILLEAFAKDPDDVIRSRVAGHPGCPANILNELANDWTVRYRLAGNKNLPVEALNKLALDSLSIAALRAQEVLNLDSSDWFKRTKSKASPKQLEAFASGNFLELKAYDPNKLMSSRSSTAKVLAAASNAADDPARLAKASSSTDWLVRAAIASNMHTPPNILQKLAKDPHTLVKALAQAPEELRSKQRTATTNLAHTTQRGQLLAFLEAVGHWITAHTDTPRSEITEKRVEELGVFKPNNTGDSNLTEAAFFDFTLKELEEYTAVSGGFQQTPSFSSREPFSFQYGYHRGEALDKRVSDSFETLLQNSVSRTLALKFSSLELCQDWVSVIQREKPALAKHMTQHGANLELDLLRSKLLPADVSAIWRGPNMSFEALGEVVMIECCYSLNMHEDTERSLFLSHWNDSAPLLWQCSKKMHVYHNGRHCWNDMEDSWVLKSILVQYRKDGLQGFVKLLKAKPSIVLSIIGPVFAKDLVPAVVLCLLQKANKQKALTWLDRHRTRALPALAELRDMSTLKRETEAIELALKLLRDN